MKTACYLVKVLLPDTARPTSESDVIAGSIGFIIEQKARHLFSGAARVEVFPVACAFTQPGALCKELVGAEHWEIEAGDPRAGMSFGKKLQRTVAELNAAAMEENP